MIVANVADAAWEAISTEPISFMIGALIGWVAAQRYRIVRVRKAKESS